MEIKRDNLLQRLVVRKHNKMIKVVTGMRRSGKSYLLFTLFRNELLASGVDEVHIVSLALDQLENAHLREPKMLLDYLKNKLVDEQMHYLLLDEVQYVQHFEEVLNSLLHLNNVDVYVTGSNARFLSKDVITEFRGRGDEVRIHPLSFAEYYSANPSANPYPILQQYMLYGGLPQLVEMATTEQKESYLKSLFYHTYLRDIRERYDIRNDDDLSELVDYLASAIGTLTNPLNLKNTFKTVKKSDISVNTISAYLEYLQDAFLIEKSVRYDVKGKRYISTPMKYYFEDTGLRNARLDFRQVDESHLFENMIYNELRNRGLSVDVGQVYVDYKDEAGKTKRKTLEIDFVCNKGYQRYYIQAALALTTQEKYDQELASLRSIRDSFKKIMIVGATQPTYKNEDGILILNIFDFLLQDNALEM